MPVWIAIFIFSLIILIRASGFFTESAEKLPELVSSVFSVQQGASEIVIGNVLGSNITNIFLVLGVVAILGERMKITYELIHVDLPLLVGSAFLLAMTVWDRVFSLPEAFLCLAGYSLYALYTVHLEREHEHPALKKEQEKKRLDRKTLFVLFVSAFFIYLGAKYTVESIIKLSEFLSIGKEVIAASAVALGTSLPELMVSATAAKQGKPELAIGNVLGSNIFNAFAVMGVSAMFGPLVIPASITGFTLPLMLGATLLYVFITQDRQITKWEGGLLVIFYVFYIGKLFNKL
jgi:cation:H+ antiporter